MRARFTLFFGVFDELKIKNIEKKKVISYQIVEKGHNFPLWLAQIKTTKVVEGRAYNKYLAGSYKCNIDVGFI